MLGPDVEAVWVGDLVGVHGIAQQQRGRHQLIAAWAPALADGIEASVRRRVTVPELDIAFYGDLFRSPRMDRAKAPHDDADNARLLADMGVDELQAIGDMASDLLDADMAASADDEVPVKGIGRVPLPLQSIIAAVDRRCGHRGAGVLLLGELRQVRRYLLDPDIKEQVDARTREAAFGCRVLIGHS